MNFLPTIINIEKVLGEIGKTLYEPLQEDTLVNTLEGEQMGN